MIHRNILNNVLSYVDLDYIYYMSSNKGVINLSEIEKKLYELYDKKDVKRIYYLIVELSQNISRYKSEYSDNEEILVILKNENNDDLYLVSGNYVTNEQCLNFTSKIDYLNNLNLDELNNYYMKCLEKGGYNEKGGAGLGLIEMSRKTEHKLTYFVKKINENYSFVYNIVRYTLKTERHINLKHNLKVKEKEEIFI